MSSGIYRVPAYEYCPQSCVISSTVASVAMTLLPHGLWSSAMVAPLVPASRIPAGSLRVVIFSASPIFCYTFGYFRKIGNSEAAQSNLPRNPLQVSLFCASCAISNKV